MLLRAVHAVQSVLKRHKLGYTLLIAMVVVVGSGLLVATIEEAIATSGRSPTACGGP